MISEHWYDCDLAVIDVETTGLDAKNDRVIEIGIVHMRAGKLLESWGQLIDPEREIPPEVVKLTGIQPEDCKGQPTFASMAAEIRSRLEGRVVVAYNLEFDRSFVTEELRRAGSTWPDGPALDPLVFARELQASQGGSKRLGKVAERLGIELLEAHRAVNDAEVAGKVLYAFREQLPSRLQDLTTLQAQWAQQQEQLMAARKRRRGVFDEAEPAESTGPSVIEVGGIAKLGPAYIYGTESDPVRFLYGQLPDVGSTRR